MLYIDTYCDYDTFSNKKGINIKCNARLFFLHSIKFDSISIDSNIRKLRMIANSKVNKSILLMLNISKWKTDKDIHPKILFARTAKSHIDWIIRDMIQRFVCPNCGM